MSLNKFITEYMKDNFKQLDSDNIKKIYNKEFDVLIYNHKNRPNTIVIDKRNANQTVVYNTLEIASHHMLKKIA